MGLQKESGAVNGSANGLFVRSIMVLFFLMEMEFKSLVGGV